MRRYTPAESAVGVGAVFIALGAAHAWWAEWGMAVADAVLGAVGLAWGIYRTLRPRPPDPWFR